MPLTNTAIRNAKPSNKPIRLFDERGLYLEVSPTGGKWWRLKFRFEGKEKRLSLGVYPDVPLKDARDRRDAALKLLADGIVPSENRKAQKLARADSAANSFEVVAREWLSSPIGTGCGSTGSSTSRNQERMCSAIRSCGNSEGSNPEYSRKQVVARCFFGQFRRDRHLTT
jgi:hypothetical protein